MTAQSTPPTDDMIDAWSRATAEGDAKYGPDTWRGRDPKIDMLAAVRHLSHAILWPGARDESSGELHIHHAFARLAIAVANIGGRST